MKMLSRALPALALFSWILLAGCGLPTVTYLYPPIEMTVDQGAVMVQNDSRNFESSESATQTFKGIEIFYRAYQYDADASAALTALSNLANTYSSDPESFMTIATNDSYGFLRLKTSEPKGAPLLALNAGDGNNYYLRLNPYTDWTLTDSANISVFTDGSTIIRNLPTSTSSTSFNLKDFNFGDDDYTGSTINPGDTLYIVFFSVSFGIDQTSVGQTVYSGPNIPDTYVSY